MIGEKTTRLLGRVAFLERLRRVGRRFHLFALIGAGLYVLLLMISRFLALIPNHFGLLTTLIPFAAALVLAVILSRRVTRADAARLVDAKVGTKDLYLTAVYLDDAMGDYKPLVHQAAEEHAPAIEARRVAPFTGHRRAIHLACALGLLFLWRLRRT